MSVWQTPQASTLTRTAPLSPGSGLLSSRNSSGSPTRISFIAFIRETGASRLHPGDLRPPPTFPAHPPELSSPGMPPPLHALGDATRVVIGGSLLRDGLCFP